MPAKCPRCGSTDTEELDDDLRWFCPGCSTCWKPEQPPRLLEPPPSTEERRRDLA